MAMKPKKDLYPQTFETFKEPGAFTLDMLKRDTPSCFNGIVSVRKYRVTIELVDEPVDVIQRRIQALWDDITNHHDREPLFSAGMKYGMDLREKRPG